MSFLCRAFRHRWRYVTGSDFGPVGVTTVTLRHCRRRRCALRSRFEIVSTRQAGLGGTDPVPPRYQ